MQPEPDRSAPRAGRPAVRKVSIARRPASDAGVHPPAGGKSARPVPADWFELLAETTFDGVGVTQDGVVVEVNERLASMLGYERHEIVGAPVAKFVSPAHRDLVRSHEAHRGRGALRARRAAQGRNRRPRGGPGAQLHVPRPARASRGRP